MNVLKEWQRLGKLDSKRLNESQTKHRAKSTYFLAVINHHYWYFANVFTLTDCKVLRYSNSSLKYFLSCSASLFNADT